MKWKTLIVDDEPLARERIRDLLQLESDIEVVGECADGVSALEFIQIQQPDLVFLDIQMPEMSGLETLSLLDPSQTPFVIFVTAYDQYAVQAFEKEALDYLLKPFNEARFKNALDRFRKNAPTDSSQPDSWAIKLKYVLEQIQDSDVPPTIAAKKGDAIVLLDKEEIDWVEAADNYIILHANAEQYFLRSTLSSFQKRYPNGPFLRIHRSLLVNQKKVRELHPLFNGEYTIVLHSGKKLKSSRSYKVTIQQLSGF